MCHFYVVGVTHSNECGRARVRSRGRTSYYYVVGVTHPYVVGVTHPYYYVVGVTQHGCEREVGAAINLQT